MKNVKTNAMRILDGKKIDYEILSIDLKEAESGTVCADILGIPYESTFKTLVTIAKSKNYYVFVIPVNEKLDLKKAASAVNEKSIEMLPMKDLFGLTGYVHGGCSPIGMKRLFTTVIDETAILFDQIVFSGGKIGYFIKMNPNDINFVVPITFVDIVEG